MRLIRTTSESMQTPNRISTIIIGPRGPIGASGFETAGGPAGFTRGPGSFWAPADVLVSVLGGLGGGMVGGWVGWLRFEFDFDSIWLICLSSCGCTCAWACDCASTGGT